MQVTNPNNVKIYNLSAGKSLPEWFNDRKKRSLVKKDHELRRRIQLIQDFDMPTVSNCVQMSKDNQYILATGVYKPRIRCFDVNQMSMKFERCMDSEVIKFQLLSDDYSKIVFLQVDRFVEFHSQHGHYYKTRIPTFGRDFTYLDSTTDLYFVGASSEVTRLNLEIGKFLAPLKTHSNEFNCCQINPYHELFSCGSTEGIVECWDPRSLSSVGKLDTAVALASVQKLDSLPVVTALKFSSATILAAGLSTGHVLIYEMRMNRPLLIKDHNYGLPIKDIEFHKNDLDQNLVLSIDKKILKIWNQDNGKAFTAIEAESALNNLCLVPNSGLLFLANESKKILTYYIPDLGQAPKWCSTLTSITEELEENPHEEVYDDYKFLTRSEVDSLGLSHLIGTNILRAEMHGYYIRMEIYHKAKSLVEPFNYEDYKKKNIEMKNKVDQRIKSESKLPKVNKLLAEKLLVEIGSKKAKNVPDLLNDIRFSAMFTDSSFQVDEQSAEYQLLKPVVSKLEKAIRKKNQKNLSHHFQPVDQKLDDELEGRASSEEGDESSSDDDQQLRDEIKEQHRKVQLQRKGLRDNRLEDKNSKSLNIDVSKQKQPKFYELKSGHKMDSLVSKKAYKLSKKCIGNRLEEADKGIINQIGTNFGNMELTFKWKKSSKEQQRKEKSLEHHKERKKIRRPAGQLHAEKSGPFNRQ